MDCEKFDSVMLDELYGELDEVTSAAARRHLAACARCSAAMAGLEATRRVAVLPLVEPPADLAERVLAKTWEAQKVVPIGSRFSRFVSRAGSWAMRPQTAMAAVFLLMIGSSVLFLQTRKSEVSSSSGATNAFGGAPAPAAAAPDEKQQAFDYSAAASAHGTEPLKLMPQATSAPATGTPALDPFGNAPAQQAPGAAAEALASRDETLSASNAGVIGGAGGQGQAQAAPPAARAAGPSDDRFRKGASAHGADLEEGLSEYKDKKYDQATKTLDGVPDDPTAALWAARAVRDGKGCGAAIQRFEDVSTRAWGTAAGYEATFDAARCYETLGRSDLARARYAKLLGVPQYAARSQNELDRLQPAAAKPAAPRAVVPAPAATSTGTATGRSY